MKTNCNLTSYLLHWSLVCVLTVACTGRPWDPDAVTAPTGDPPTVEWYQGLGTDREEHVHEGLETSDGGFIAIGHHSESDGKHTDMLVIKTGPQGEQEWQAILGTSREWDVGYAVAEVADGYLAAGALGVDGVQHSGLIKLNRAGEAVWSKTFHSNGNAAIRGIDVATDSSLIATGYQGSPEPGFRFIIDEAQGFLLKLNANGERVWEHPLPYAQGTKVRQTDDSGYAVLAMTWIVEDGVDYYNPALLKTDEMGQELWRNNYGNTEPSQAFDFDVNEDGSYVLAGHTTAFGAENWDCALTKVNADGEYLWTKVFGQPRGYDPRHIHDECYGVREDVDGGFVMVGGTGDESGYSERGHPSGPSDEWKAFVVKVDKAGSVVWLQVYGAGADRGHDAAEYLGLTSDGGYVLFNDSDSTGSPAPNNFGFMKLRAVTP